MGKLQFYQYPREEIFHSCLGEGITGQPASSATNDGRGWDAYCLRSTRGALPQQHVGLSPRQSSLMPSHHPHGDAPSFREDLCRYTANIAR